MLAWLSLLTRTYTNIGTYHLSSALLSWIVEIMLSVMSGVPIHITCSRIQRNLIYQLSAKRQPRYSKKTALSCMHQVSNPPIPLSLSLSLRKAPRKRKQKKKKGLFPPRLSCHVIFSAPRSAMALCLLPFVISRLHPITVERRLSKVDLQ